MVDFDALAGDDAVGGSDDFAVTQVELGLIELRLSLLDLGFGLLGFRILRGNLLRTGFGVLELGLGLGLAIVGHADSVSGGLLIGARTGQRSFGGIGGGDGGVELLLADDIFRDQRFVALKVRLRLGVVGFSLGNGGVRSHELLLGLGHAGLGASDVGV